MKKYDYVIIGAGIAGCSTAHFLSKYSDSVLLVDRNSDVAQGASGAAGAFLSPLLGKPNAFKSLVTKALKFSTEFYKQEIPEFIRNCGVLRIPKNNKDREKFKSYIPYMDFEFEEKGEGYFFPIGSLVDSYETCRVLAKKSKKLFNYEIKHILYRDNVWLLNNEIEAKNLIITTGADTTLIDEKYFTIRAVWGQRIICETTTCTSFNYHKECSISVAKKLPETSDSVNTEKFTLSIGATHHRFDCDNSICNYCLKGDMIEKSLNNVYQKSHYNNDTRKLLDSADDIIKLENVKVIGAKAGARASSTDYFPLSGSLIDSKTTLDMYPYIKKGSKVPQEKFIRHKKLFVLNGVGGRGFVLSAYLAKNLVEHIVKNKKIIKEVEVSRLFKRWARKNGND